MLEKVADISAIPRAAQVDGDGLRIWSLGGLSEHDLQHSLPLSVNLVIGHPRDNLQSLLKINPSTHINAGYYASNFIYQPFVEEKLRIQCATLLPHVQVQLFFGYECRITDVKKNEDNLTVVPIFEIATGISLTLFTRYLVGCDGGTSATRRCITGGKFEGTSFSSDRWLVCDCTMAPSSSVVPPFSDNFYFICQPTRSGVQMPLPFGHLRYEFALEVYELLSFEKTSELSDTELLSFLRERFLERGVNLRDLILHRCIIYTYHARVSKLWSEGPANSVILAGLLLLVPT